MKLEVTESNFIIFLVGMWLQYVLSKLGDGDNTLIAITVVSIMLAILIKLFGEKNGKSKTKNEPRRSK